MENEPTTHVLQINTDDIATKQDILERLRALNTNPISTRHWRWENLEGTLVLAEGHDGAVMIYRDVCRELLGEDV